MKKLLVGVLIVVAGVFMFSVPCVMPQDFCEGDLDGDQDVDSDDVSKFLEDFGRSIYNDPCPPCPALVELENRIAELEARLAGVSRNGNDLEFSGLNVYINNATGTTNGAVNGLGNLIVGYNELRGSGDNRSGSHNVVVGRRQNYSSYGGLVVGDNNTISGSYASVSGGTGNIASNQYASVSGGERNQATGPWASVSGGEQNVASGDYASVSGGAENIAGGNIASVSGGEYNEASYYGASVSGGYGNDAESNYASVSGGDRNNASGYSASVSGGYQNTASGSYSSVSGGYQDNVGGAYDWRAGDLFQDD